MSKTTLIPVTRRINFHLITLFPESCSSYIQESIIARAQKEKRIGIFFYNPRNYVKATKAQKGKDKPYLRVDDKPYGGGPGMVMEAMPVIKAIEAAQKKAEVLIKKSGSKPKFKVIFLSPGGKQFTNELAMKWVGKVGKVEKAGASGAAAKSVITDMIIICGRYEGVDERVNAIFKSEPISVGPFVTTGGELPALIIIDAMARHIPGVLGNFDSREEARHASSAVYTRPEILEYKGKKYKVPEVLLSGDHKKIEEWRAKGSI
jgi:tRNA (guanine37-N1)-methyltransferase